MIGRKLLTLRNGTLISTEEKFAIKIPNLHEVRYIVTRGTSKYGFIALVVILRIYVLSGHSIKKTSKKIHHKIKELHKKYLPHKHKEEVKEASKFLKMMSDYKQKVKRIKHQIKEEEGIE
jgi:uncharacterized membrane-anchored protein YjiN (DUF445 family)